MFLLNAGGVCSCSATRRVIMSKGRVGSLHAHYAVLTLLLLPVLVTAQSQNAELTGSIADPSGGLVPEVQVTVTNVATGERRAAVTNEAGLYTIPLLQPGKYEIAIRKEGFRSLTRT